MGGQSFSLSPSLSVSEYESEQAGRSRTMRGGRGKWIEKEEEEESRRNRDTHTHSGVVRPSVLGAKREADKKVQGGRRSRDLPERSRSITKPRSEDRRCLPLNLCDRSRTAVCKKEAGKSEGQ